MDAAQQRRGRDSRRHLTSLICSFFIRQTADSSSRSGRKREKRRGRKKPSCPFIFPLTHASFSFFSLSDKDFPLLFSESCIVHEKLSNEIKLQKAIELFHNRICIHFSQLPSRKKKLALKINLFFFLTFHDHLPSSSSFAFQSLMRIQYSICIDFVL